MKIVIYCKHEHGFRDLVAVPQKVVKVVRGCASVHVPRVGDFVQLNGMAVGPVDMVQWNFSDYGGLHEAWVRLPPDFNGDFKEVPV
jgi:hypothetical protein